MSQVKVKVLLIGESGSGSSFLRRQLESHGCQCWFARSTQESGALHGKHLFDLILNTAPFREVDLLLTALGNAPCQVFHCVPTEESCWWMPAARNGQKCFGAPGLRPSEFMTMLDEILQTSVAAHAPLKKPLVQSASAGQLKAAS